MTIRNDISINWGVSPRIIEVAAPSVELTIQDLYDTLRDLASKPEAMDDMEIVDAGGGETLTTEESVFLTVTLLNAKLKFEERTSWTVCEILSGNLVAKDSNNEDMSPIEPSPYVNVDRAKSSSGTLVNKEDMATKTDVQNTISDNNPALIQSLWNKPLSELIQPNTIGQYIKQNVMTTSRFMALK